MPPTAALTNGSAERIDSRSGGQPLLLKDVAYEQLRELVLNGQLAQMPFLSERKLAKQLGMSLTPVRSAVERLEVEGLLAIGPQQGLMVRELSEREIADHFEIRQALETLVVRKLAGQLRPEQAAALRQNLDEQQRCLQSDSIHDYIARDSDFHMQLAEFAGNADIEQVLRQRRDRIFQVVLRVFRHVPARRQLSIDEHYRIVAELEAGDAAAAAATMSKHLRGGLKALLPDYKVPCTAIHE